jgi:hypothetical protein
MEDQQFGLSGIAVDKSGNVFVTADNLTGNYDHVEKYTNTGKFIREWGHVRAGNITTT